MTSIDQRHGSRPEMGRDKKNLQIFIDGTGNSAADGTFSSLTNLFRLILALNYESNQYVNYMSGVGTRGDITSVITARGIDEILREAYVNLASNYLPGDDIYMFGYSRGGAIALALADIIEKVGLLKADHIYELRSVWEVYVERRGKKALTDAELRELRTRNLDQNIWKDSNAPRIKFLGLFDPVPGNKWDILFKFSQLRLNYTDLPANVDAACSILSINDNRKPSFNPVIIRKKSREDQHLEQIWMPGVHADIGGNSGSLLLSDMTLLTMISNIVKYTNLNLSTSYVKNIEFKIGRDMGVMIDNERPGFLRKLLFCGNRQVGLTCEADGNSALETIHPIFDYLISKKFSIKGKNRIYSSENVPANMERYDEIYEKLFERAVDDALVRDGRKR